MINDHKPEAAADCRSIFGVSLWDVRPVELMHLLPMLMQDPTSRMHAAVAGWQHPVSRESLVLMDLIDVQLASKSKRKPKPYPRPFDAQAKRVGRTATRHSPSQIDALLGR